METRSKGCRFHFHISSLVETIYLLLDVGFCCSCYCQVTENAKSLGSVESNSVKAGERAAKANTCKDL